MSREGLFLSLKALHRGHKASRKVKIRDHKAKGKIRDPRVSSKIRAEMEVVDKDQGQLRTWLIFCQSQRVLRVPSKFCHQTRS